MAQDHYYSGLNMHLNIISEHILDKMTAKPSTGEVEGRIIYLSSDKRVYYYDGSLWRPMGEVQDVQGTSPIIVGVADGVYSVSIIPATGSNAGSMSASHWTKLENLLEITDDNDVPHKSGGSEYIIGSGISVFSGLSALDAWAYAHTGSGDASTNRPHGELKYSEMDTDTTLGGSGASDAKTTSQLAVKTYIDTLVSGSGRPAEPYATGGIRVDYPATYGGGGILKGDQWIISDDGGSVGPVTGAVDVNSNDTLIANQDAPGNVHANWTVIASTPVQDATETIKGIQRNATDAEALAMTLNNVTLTPAKLKLFIDNLNITQEVSESASTDSITVSHGWNNKNVSVSCHIDATGVEIRGQVVKTAANVTVTLTTGSVASFGGSWTVSVIGEDKS